MNRWKLDGMAWLTVMVIIIVVAVWSLCSCGTRKVVTEYVAVHDTLVINHSDTVRMEIVKTKTDTLREYTIKEVTLQRDTAGKTDTVRVNIINDHYRYIYEGDSSSVYRVAVDSILKSLDKLKNKETVKTRPLVRWWEYGLAALIVGGIAVWVLKSRLF